ncbi:hypothetical protein Aph01nite_04390 [Acrocarpospora phusangensis]|uniref:DUF8094 domain-containing protein n=1 Tax=Acrocarpospora phusangensis TaxID=1070424 RepID=A0A919UHJ4_9ACTN|nr:hypothetical protein [Acrocarpospora phusangensis]GIH22129.1 hypothetical protein Aph01nite_04390 [Acrocarpospora phusangensis]
MRRALALVVLAAAAASCTSPPAQPSPPPPKPSPVAATTAAPSPTPRPVALTLEDAADALREHLAADDVARVAGDERWALDLARDGQDLLTIAQYRAADMKPPRYTWGKPTLIVPRQYGDAPLWFAAVLDRRQRGEETRKALLVFVKQGDLWQNSFESLLEADLPPLKLDEEGYATALDARDQSIAISPYLMGPLHATIAEEGRAGYASDLIEPGPRTTGYFAEIKRNRESFKAGGLAYDSLFALAVGFPVYAVRTDDGGGLVLYSLTRTTTWTAKVENAQGGHLEVPEEARWALLSAVIVKERRILETQQYVGFIPPKDSSAPAEVVGYDGLVTKASAT